MNAQGLGLVQFSERDLSSLGLLPSQRETLVRLGIPNDLFGRFSAAVPPFAISSVRGGLVVVGTTGLAGKICLDQTSGEVVEVVDPSVSPIFVNKSVSEFTRTAQLVFSLFPFHPRGADLTERDRSAKNVAAEIRKIDPLAMAPDRFWSTLVDDIVVGDFDEDVMEFIG